jgi:sortase (surface protein transpeptidase)
MTEARRPAGEVPPGESGPGSNSDLANGGDRAAGIRPAVPGDGLATGGATAAASTAVAVAEAPPSTGTSAAPAEYLAPADPAPASETPPAGTDRMQRLVLRGSAVALLLLAVVVLGFVVYLYGLSDVQEARSQALLYSQFQLELANQVAPLGPDGPNGLDGAGGATIPGSPVAILNIPSIGIRDLVVVQGTTPQNLMVGPGHRPDSPLPGQPGVVQIYGRRATFGAPFSRLGELRPGDIITAITGQGTSTYTVAAAAPSSMIIKDPSPGRMVLLTAYSPTVPTYYYQVDADLTSSVKPSPGVAPAVYSTELPLANDTSTLAMTMVWSLALVLVAAIGTVAAIKWSPWAAYLAGVPLAMAVLWCLYESLAALLPNLY